MSYLAIARAVVTGYERNESDEKSPTLSAQDRAPSTRFEPILPADAATLLALQDEIVAAASAARDAFDRAAYDELWRRWHALQHEGMTNL